MNIPRRTARNYGSSLSYVPPGNDSLLTGINAVSRIIKQEYEKQNQHATKVQAAAFLKEKDDLEKYYKDVLTKSINKAKTQAAKKSAPPIKSGKSKNSKRNTQPLQKPPEKKRKVESALPLSKVTKRKRKLPMPPPVEESEEESSEYSESSEEDVDDGSVEMEESDDAFFNKYA